MQEIIQLFAAFLGSLGFAVLFNIRGEKLVFAALGGLLSWGVYLGAGYIDNNPYFCGFTASVLLTLFAASMSPGITFTTISYRMIKRWSSRLTRI